MLDQSQDPIGHEPRSADWGASTGYLGHLHHTATGVDLNAAPVAACDHLVRAHLVAGINHDLDSVTTHPRTVPRHGPDVWGDSPVSQPR
jgi:hypothetical protein